jgi:hypothetical protein
MQLIEFFYEMHHWNLEWLKELPFNKKESPWL